MRVIEQTQATTVEQDDQFLIDGDKGTRAITLANLETVLCPQNEISDAFAEEKDYAVDDYCIYLNRLYRFTAAKAAGPWDGSAVIPVTISQELMGVRERFKLGSLAKSFVAASDSNNQEFLQTHRENGDYYQLIASKKGLWFEGSESGQYGNFWQAALKSDLLKYQLITISGTTDANGVIVVAVKNDFVNQKCFVLSNVSTALGRPWVITVDSNNKSGIAFRFRKMADNTTVVNTDIGSAFTVLVVGI